MEIAPIKQPSTYFAIAAAVAGVAGACGTTAGGFLAQAPTMSLGGLFALSSSSSSPSSADCDSAFGFGARTS